MKITAITSAALLTLMALAGCSKHESPEGNPAPSAAPAPPYQAPQDTNPSASPEGSTTPSDNPGSPPDQGNPAFGEPTPPPSDTQPEPPKNPG